MSDIFWLLVILSAIGWSESNPSIYQDYKNKYIDSTYSIAQYYQQNSMQQMELNPTMFGRPRYPEEKLMRSHSKKPRKPGNDQGFHGKYIPVSENQYDQVEKLWGISDWFCISACIKFFWLFRASVGIGSCYCN